jgi:hypothetical protein
MARDRVGAFVRAWRRHFNPLGVDVVTGVEGVKLLLADLDALSRPRVVVRTLAQLQALQPGTVIRVQGDRAAQIEAHETYDDEGELSPATRIVYVGTDLYDLLTDPDPLTRDTLRRMLPAIVIDPLD